ncbi:MAG: response regulator [Alphaproteobacteria bacterium]|nr:response regulator [Alphaproteobacteria bacterium]
MKKILRDWLYLFIKSVQTVTSSFKRVEQVGFVSAINVILILLLGTIMLISSGQPLFFYSTLILMISTCAMVVVLLFKLQQLKVNSRIDHIKSKGYDTIDSPLLILTPELHFGFGNKRAAEACWWAESIPYLKKVLSQSAQMPILDRLIEGLQKKEERQEILHLQGVKGEEIWSIHSFPLGENALWHCTNTSEETFNTGSSYSQLNSLTLFLDNAEHGLFSINEKGTLLFCNEHFSKWLGYTRDEMIGNSLSKYIVKSRNHGNTPLYDIQGKCDFLTASSRIKSGYLEQKLIQSKKGETLTYSHLNIHAPFANYDDMIKVVNMTPLPVICLDENGLLQDSNVLFREKFIFDEPPARETSFIDLVIESQRDEIRNALHSFLKKPTDETCLDIYLNDNRESVVAAYLAPLPLKEKKGFMILLQDITDQKSFETRLVQSQKMQAVGQLAGGIAHDFNNLLTAMIGFCDLLLLRYTPGDQSFTDVMQIKQNANRAANLVRQLLAFSRQQTLQPKIMDITDCLAEISALLRRLIGSNIELNMKHARDLGLVLVDQGQFEQVIINMVVNARDAMDGTGTITVTTENCELKKSKRFGHDVVPAGSYVLVEIADTGSGINPEIIDRIFDPFFSTKEVGSGTGLGLSTVYGIVKQTGGFIHVKSKEGEGTTFSIYLPHCTVEKAEEPPQFLEEKSTVPDLTGSSTILLVEDEDAVRLFSARALRSKGYEVLEAINGEEALQLIKTNKHKIDLIISDVVMPQMDGPTFINKINQFAVNPKVLFISGYTEDTFHDRIKDNANIRFLAKPFSLNDLATRVKEILGEKPSSLRNVS